MEGCNKNTITNILHPTRITRKMMLTLTARGVDFGRQNQTSVRRQILTSKVNPHTVRVKIFIMVVDP